MNLLRFLETSKVVSPCVYRLISAIGKCKLHKQGISTLQIQWRSQVFHIADQYRGGGEQLPPPHGPRHCHTSLGLSEFRV